MKPSTNRERQIFKDKYRNIKKRHLDKGFSKSSLASLKRIIDASSSPCVYCGIESSIELKDRLEGSDVTVLANTVDRIDSNKGYTSENIQSCCKTCNSAKNIMGHEEFLNWIAKVYQFNFK